MDVKSSQLKIFVVLFVLFVVVGAGITIRSSHLADVSNRTCEPAQSASNFEQQVDAIAPEAMKDNLACDKQ